MARGESPVPAAVICHPHPMGGGNMHNGVVMAIADSLASRGMIALRFNFRGVGASEGAHDDGRGERDDVGGALNWLAAQPSVDPGRLCLVGYSFGACAGLAHALTDPRVSAFVAVGLPVQLCDPDVAGALAAQDTSQPAPWAFDCPKLFVTGERDQVAPPGQLLRLVERLATPKRVQVVSGADHFWWGLEHEVGEQVAAFLTGLWGDSTQT